MEYNVTKNNIHICDSYLYSKYGFQSRLELIHEDHPECEVFDHRSYWYMKMEWATHNFLYMLRFWTDHTQDVDLNYPQKWYIKLAYAVAGPISWVFIE